jgi:phosphohistidine phosphatase
VEFEAVLVSPRERALRTAVAAAQAWSSEQRERLEIHEPLSAGFDVEQALMVLDRPPTHAVPPDGVDRRLLVVGHEPDLSNVVGGLTGARIDLKKGGLAVVRTEGPSGELIALLRPRELALIATG